MHAVSAALQLFVIAYPLVFVIMAIFTALTFGLVKLFPAGK